MRGSYLHMKTGESNPLCELVGHLPINHLRMPGAEKSRFDEELDREFPFQIKAHVFANRHDWSPQEGQDCLALIIPLDGLLRVDIGERLIELGRRDLDRTGPSYSS